MRSDFLNVLVERKKLVGADVGFLGGRTPTTYITKINLKTLLKKKSEKTSEKEIWSLAGDRGSALC